MSWQHDVVDGLLEQRAAGVRDFATAWRRATRGLQRPRDWVGGDHLGIPYSTWFRAQCQREWDGECCADFINLRDLLGGEGAANASRVRTKATSAERAHVIA